jgi:hypothetical protein
MKWKLSCRHEDKCATHWCCEVATSGFAIANMVEAIAKSLVSQEVHVVWIKCQIQWDSMPAFLQGNKKGEGNPTRNQNQEKRLDARIFLQDQSIHSARVTAIAPANVSTWSAGCVQSSPST